MKSVFERARQYFQLLKSLQTALLTLTGVAGFMSARCPVIHWMTMVCLVTSLIFSISGSTVLNMWYDHDIDRVMDRTHHRPLARGLIPVRKALVFGLTLCMLGIALGFLLSPLFGSILLAGILFDVVIYTLWLKRRTCWSIVWGGLAGGMPILAGRALGMDNLDGIGFLLMFAVLFWIPTHIITFSLRYAKDYQAAGIPTFNSTYGVQVARNAIAVSSIIAGAFILTATILIGVRQGFLHLVGILSGGLMILAFLAMVRPSDKLNFRLFKYASIYMLITMVLLAI